jgi:hypothetical protein
MKCRFFLIETLITFPNICFYMITTEKKQKNTINIKIENNNSKKSLIMIMFNLFTLFTHYNKSFIEKKNASFSGNNLFPFVFNIYLLVQPFRFL